MGCLVSGQNKPRLKGPSTGKTLEIDRECLDRDEDKKKRRPVLWTILRRGKKGGAQVEGAEEK